ncbi:MAG: cytochrome c oxidase assembly protein, partial [Ilumatobacter sp.]
MSDTVWTDVIAHTSPVEHGVLVAVGIIAVVVYGWGWLQTGRASVWRLTAWCAGVAALLVSVLPVMERWAQRSFTGHMVQHLVMIVVAAPLVVVARPVATSRALGWVPRRTTTTERSLARRWRSHGAIASAAAFVLVLYATHLTGIYDAALRNRFVHDVEHVAYVCSAIA